MPYKDPEVAKAWARERYAKRRANNQCVMCGEPTGGKAYCEKHSHDANRYKNITRRRAYTNDYVKKLYWSKRKELGLEPRKIYHGSERLQRQKETREQWVKHKREEADLIFGNTCYFCGRSIRMATHNKLGLPHRGRAMPMFALLDTHNWVRLCYPCHKAVHWCMEHFDMSWEEIENKYR